jgi:hypothetical protein
VASFGWKLAVAERKCALDENTTRLDAPRTSISRTRQVDERQNGGKHPSATPSAARPGSVEPFAYARLGDSKESRAGEVFAGVQGGLPGKVRRPTVSVSYFRRLVPDQHQPVSDERCTNLHFWRGTWKYSGWLTVESRAADDPESALGRSLKYLKQLWAEA